MLEGCLHGYHHTLLLFFGLALLLSWVIWAPSNLDRSGLVLLGLDLDSVLVSYDLVIPPSQSSLPGFEIMGRQVASSNRKTGGGWSLLGMIVPFGLVGMGATFRRTDRKRWLQLAFLIVLLLIVIGLSGSIDIYGSMRGSYSFPTSDSARDYLLDPSSALPEWRFPNGSGTVVFDLTVISEDMDGNRTQESCNTTLTIAGEAAVYPDGVIKKSEN